MKTQGLEEIDHLFENVRKENLTAESSKNELNAMRNTQPPEKPTFFVNQERAKEEIKRKLKGSLSEDKFSCILLQGVIGDGKTHFLNHMYSHFKKNKENFYIIKLRVEDTERYKRNLVKTMVAELFSNYYEDFFNTFHTIINEIPMLDDVTYENELNIIRMKLNVADDLAKVLIKLRKADTARAAIRILGASNGRTELKKLDVKELSSTDYIEVLRLFSNCSANGEKLFIIILDEFEHAYGLPSYARNIFFPNFKQFYDAAGPGFKRVSFIAALTEQSAKASKSKEDMETAMWTRLEPNIVELDSFRITQENIKQLLNHIAIRYEKAYEYLIDSSMSNEIMKELLKHLNSTQATNYRYVVSSLIRIIDSKKDNFSFNLSKPTEELVIDKTEELEFDLFSFFENSQTEEILGKDNINLDTSPNALELQVSKLKNEAVNAWDKSSGQGRNSQMKTSFEKALINFGFNLTKIFTHKKGTSTRVEASKNVDDLYVFYVTTAKTGKTLLEKFEECLKLKDDMMNDDIHRIKLYFVYPYEARNDSLIEKFILHPEVHDMGLEQTIYYDLLTLRLAKNKDELNYLIHKIEDSFIKNGLLERDRNEFNK
ncbi:hypothetical protein ACFTRD_00610 [Paenibacillus sp. NPDC056933]|uniref:hypothetical protein n=1 Tax=Paenibacillus sp. NPDC056933 TaxID=3345968 RepID=UPI003638275C